jgi:hypothetical protein
MGQALLSKPDNRTVRNRWVLVALDIAAGFMSTSRLIVTLVGCFTLIGVAVVYSNEAVRNRVVEVAPAMFAGWLTDSVAVVASAVVATEEAEEASRVDSNSSTRVARADLVPEQRNVTRYLARRYRVADEAVRVLVTAAYRAGEEHSLDPLLILAVMAVESSMNPFAESTVGAQGLMQVMTRVHTEKFEPHGGDHAALDPVANIMVGSAILKDLIRRGGSVERGLQLYVGAGNLPDDGGYSGRVLGERTRIELASTGKVEAALASGMRADLRPAAASPAPEAALNTPLSSTSSPEPKGVDAEKAA